MESLVCFTDRALQSRYCLICINKVSILLMLYFRKSVVTNLTLEWLLSFINRCNMSIHVAFQKTTEVTNVNCEWFASFMNQCNMTFTLLFWEHLSVVTNFALEDILSLMNKCNMSIHDMSSAVVTNVKLEWLLFLMNRWNMYIHNTLLRTALVTNVALENFSFMNRSNMSINVSLSRTTVVANITAFSLHELMQLMRLCSHICHIWMVSFLHELLQCVQPILTYNESFCHIFHNWMFFFHTICCSFWNLIYRISFRQFPFQQTFNSGWPTTQDIKLGNDYLQFKWSLL